MEFEFQLDEELDLSDAAVVVAFPTVGVVGSLAAAYLVEHLDLDNVGSVHSDLYPPATIVRDGRPTPPIRIYAGDKPCGPEGDCSKVVVVYSEVPPPEAAQIPMARALLAWARTAPHLVVLEGSEEDDDPSQEAGPGDDEARAEDAPAQGVSSTAAGCDLLEAKKIPCLSDGVVTGLAGAMLNEGVRTGREVVCLVSPAVEGQRDSRGAVNLLEAIDQLVVSISFDLEPLLEWAGQQEERIKRNIERSPGPDTAPPMYG